MDTGFPWILAAGALYGVIHSLLASNHAKALAARRIGLTAYRRFYRLFFSIMGAVSFLPLLALVALLPDRPIYAIPAPWVYATLALQGLALVALVIGVMQTGALAFVGIQQIFGYEGVHEAPAPSKLVVNGLYRWVRHPLYTASFVLLWLAPVMTWNLLALNIGLSAYMLIGSVYEEHKLVQQFGHDYIEYRKQTPRIVPGLRLNKPNP